MFNFNLIKNIYNKKKFIANYLQLKWLKCCPYSDLIRQKIKTALQIFPLFFRENPIFFCGSIKSVGKC